MSNPLPDSDFKHPPSLSETGDNKGTSLAGEEEGLEASTAEYIFNEQTNYVPRRTIITVSSAARVVAQWQKSIKPEVFESGSELI